jgi:progranulin
MHLPKTLFALPASLLLVLLYDKTPAQATEGDNSPSQWPYNHPPHVKYWPEDPPHRRRDLEAIQEHIVAGHTPVSVKKMSTDESEKFFPEYWGFEEHENQFAILGGGGMSNARNSPRIEHEDVQLSANDSRRLSFRPAFAFHATQESSFNQVQSEGNVAEGRRRRRNSAATLALLENRALQCPNGTSPCSTIAPNLCCALGETCFTIPDSGLGTVGCCPNGATCEGNITCAVGNTPCDSKIGGGCCISGYVCADMGCEYNFSIVRC